MLTGAFLLVACIGLWVVVFWVMTNDRAGPEEPTRGFLAMPEAERPPQRDTPAGRPAGRPGA